MQPFAVSRDGVIKLSGNAAVWRRFDAREPEIGECFSARNRHVANSVSAESMGTMRTSMPPMVKRAVSATSSTC
jgi:hypothetical protein